MEERLTDRKYTEIKTKKDRDRKRQTKEQTEQTCNKERKKLSQVSQKRTNPYSKVRQTEIGTER
jgi:hypothetical protein